MKMKKFNFILSLVLSVSVLGAGYAQNDKDRRGNKPPERAVEREKDKKDPPPSRGNENRPNDRKRPD